MSSDSFKEIYLQTIRIQSDIFTQFQFHNVWIKQDMNKNLLVNL